MTKRMLILLLAAAVTLTAVSALAQANTGNAKGKVVDEKSQPLSAATVRFIGTDGKKSEVKTNKQGEYEKTGLAGGKYKIELVVDGQLRWAGEGEVMTGQDNVMNIDLAAQAAAQKLSADQRKKIEQEAEEKRKKAEAEHTKIKNLNAMLAQAGQMQKAGDFDGAIAIFENAVKLDSTKDLLWANLGSAYVTKAKKTTDRTLQKQIAQQGVDALKKAIEIKSTDATYHDNLAQGYNLAGDPDDAIKEYQQAAQLDPTNAGEFYFNMGAVYTNTGKVDDAIAAFDKAIAANPNKADAYYWKGVNLLGKATLDPKTNKMVAPPGTAEALNKYLELSPDGKLAQPAKDLLASIGASIETSYKQRSGGKKK